MNLNDDQITTAATGLAGQVVDLALLGSRKCPKRVVPCRRQRLHLDGDTISTISDDDIEFTTTDPDVAIEHFQALPGEKTAGEVLAKLPQRLGV